MFLQKDLDHIKGLFTKDCVIEFEDIDDAGGRIVNDTLMKIKLDGTYTVAYRLTKYDLNLSDVEFCKFVKEPLIKSLFDKRREKSNMSTKYSCPICKYTTYTGFLCDHGERAASLVGAVEYANVMAGPQPTEPKMTRPEAINKFAEIMYSDDCRGSKATHNIKWATKAIDTYVALGLLKFDQPEAKEEQQKDDVKWKSNLGFETYFADGFDPNCDSLPLPVWTKFVIGGG